VSANGGRRSALPEKWSQYAALIVASMFACAPRAKSTSDFPGVATIATEEHEWDWEVAYSLQLWAKKTKGHGKDSHGLWTLTRIEDRV